MDRNSVIGLVAIAAILFTFMYVSQPSKAELAKRKAKQDSIAAVQQKQDSIKKTKELTQKKQAEKVSKSGANSAKLVAGGTSKNVSADTARTDSLQNEALVNQYGKFAALTKGTEKHFTIQNNLMKVTISNLGGRITSVQLKKYKTFYKKPLILFHEDSSAFNLNFFTADNHNIFTDSLYFQPIGNDLKVSGNDSATFKMRLYANKAKTQYVEYDYTIKGNSYMLGYNVHFVNMNKVISPRERHVYLNWEMSIPSQERDATYQRRFTTVYYKYTTEAPDNLSYREKAEQMNLDANIKWIDFKQQYFSSFLIADQSFDKMNASIKSFPYAKSDTDYIKKYSAKLALPFAGSGQQTSKMHFFFGPNNYRLLKSKNIGMQRIILRGIGGWGIFRWISEYIVIPLFNFLHTFIANYGIIILLLTLIIKGGLSPVTYKMYVSQAKQSVLKPEIEEIGEKYKDDAMKKQQATMALYKKAGASPMAGCLPMLLQTPILIALYEFFPYSVQLRQQPFLWAKDLSSYDSILHLPFNIPFYGDHVSLFTLLMAIAMFGYTKLNMQMTAATAGSSAMQKQMKVMYYLMPFGLLIWFNSYCSALSYYYFLSNAISIAQILIIKKWVIDEDKIRAQIQMNKAKSKPAKQSRFQQKMADAMKQRQALQQQNKKKR